MMIKTLRFLSYFVLLGALVFSVSSCEKDDDPANKGTGSITGVVTDDDGQPISDVTVTVSGVNEEDITATTNGDGEYTVTNVSLKLHAVTFSKTGWLTISKSVDANDFDDSDVAIVDATLVIANAKITGTISDSKNGGAPLAGVKVTIGTAGTATTGADGKFTLENLIEDNYTVTFTKDEYVTITKQVAKADFVDATVTINLNMGGLELLRGLTKDDLASADKWYYNEYRGGRNGPAYPHWDWSTDFMATLDFRGAWQEQNEGTTLQIRNNEGDRSNPADLNVFDSFVFGSKKITDDNKIMTIRLRTHNADAANPAYYGVQIIDLSAAEPAVVKIADKTYGSSDYSDIDFDLSAYVGKEIIIAIGIYRQATGDYWKQLVLNAIRFSNQKVSGDSWLPGTEVVPGWKLPVEAVRSTMPNAIRSFTGISPVAAGSGDYVNGYRSWRNVAHVAAQWHLVPVRKDTEPFPSEGFLIKTRDDAQVSTTVPDAYFYAKFSINATSDQLTFSTRNFGSNFTHFKLTTIEDNGTVTHVEPMSNTAQEASAVSDGMWKFKHGNGGGNDPNGYAKFEYDLSAFDGKDVTIAIGVYNVEPNSGENKLVFRAIDFN